MSLTSFENHDSSDVSEIGVTPENRDTEEYYDSIGIPIFHKSDVENIKYSYWSLPIEGGLSLNIKTWVSLVYLIWLFKNILYSIYLILILILIFSNRPKFYF